MNILLASTSSLYQGTYLEYIKTDVQKLFENIQQITFIPYARPGGISHDDYTQKVADFFEKLHIKAVGLHTFQNPKEAILNSEAFFTGGGNTFLLVKTLHELNLMKPLAEAIKSGKPYLGSSAGSNLAGQTLQTTNDMPIVYPPSFDCLQLIPYNINPHYLDPIPNFPHNGETRETRIKEFHTQNSIPVIGLREGNWIRVQHGKITVEGMHQTKLFYPQQEPIEIEAGTEL
ncbi:MAG: dipeptidase PepE [Chryseobacterium sp.]|nr:MAG: dipeptidase PepE [Chryseobacterium sp.]